MATSAWRCLGDASVQVAAVSSAGVEWGGETAFAERVAHEAKWEARLRSSAAEGLAESAGDFWAYLLLGGHAG